MKNDINKSLGTQPALSNASAKYKLVLEGEINFENNADKNLKF